MYSIHRRLPASVLLGICLISFVGLNPAAASIQLPVTVAATDTHRLQSVLNKRGWDAKFDASGSLIVQQSQQQMPANRKQLSSTFGEFATALADRGWSATRDDSGNLFLRPNTPVVETFQHSNIAQVRPQEATTDSLTPLQRPTKIAQLAQRLASAGWHADYTHNGQLILHLPGSLFFSRPSWNSSRVSTDQKISFEKKTPLPIIRRGPAEGIPRISRHNDFAALKEAAEDAGWSLSHATKGGLLLVPFG